MGLVGRLVKGKRPRRLGGEKGEGGRGKLCGSSGDVLSLTPRREGA